MKRKLFFLWNFFTLARPQFFSDLTAQRVHQVKQFPKAIIIIISTTPEAARQLWVVFVTQARTHTLSPLFISKFESSVGVGPRLVHFLTLMGPCIKLTSRHRDAATIVVGVVFGTRFSCQGEHHISLQKHNGLHQQQQPPPSSLARAFVWQNLISNYVNLIFYRSLGSQPRNMCWYCFDNRRKGLLNQNLVKFYFIKKIKFQINKVDVIYEKKSIWPGKNIHEYSYIVITLLILNWYE